MPPVCDAAIQYFDNTTCQRLKHGLWIDSDLPVEQSDTREVYNIPNDMNAMKNCLNSGVTFVVGFGIYSSFESKSVKMTGYVPMPGPRDTLLGGHAALVCGYNDRMQCWILQNSWGTSWGAKGYFYLPYPYLLDSSLSSNLWCL